MNLSQQIEGSKNTVCPIITVSLLGIENISHTRCDNVALENMREYIGREGAYKNMHEICTMYICTSVQIWGGKAMKGLDLSIDRFSSQVGISKSRIAAVDLGESRLLVDNLGDLSVWRAG